ncbi:F0F1 ATP synthase subunit A [Echinicola shivajiensis]|uniref:F0F1 ATP synthase subunit A n=1 Tax=Echinicola shivajiensis TaxID=1035916 RepID=UPI001FEA7110|nr:F0F1 ATP synthase subunit A [Echinicola shivajiensis]
MMGRRWMMRLSPDDWIFWEYGIFKLNATIVFTWLIMFIMVLGSILITRSLKKGIKISGWQCVLEILILQMQKQIKAIGIAKPEKYLNFLGTLFLFIAISNLCTLFPGYEPPTGSLSTTAALALTVFVAVPAYGVAELGLGRYLKTYQRPSWLMLPFNIISELTRTLSLAVRLFGNMMSGAMIVAVLVAIVPFFFPVIMQVLGLLTGMVQAYIFSILATVYIAAATRREEILDQQL